MLAMRGLHDLSVDLVYSPHESSPADSRDHAHNIVVQGTSLAPLFDGAAGPSLANKVALSQFTRCDCQNKAHPSTFICSHCVGKSAKEFEYMGCE
eukprot:COSAG01_NODE_9173_length_2529_cov_8.300000_3_plen_95_part_00